MRITNLLALAVIGTTMSACYVVPLDHPAATGKGYQSYQPHVAAAPLPAIRPVFTARMYPANDIAGRMGEFSGIITNPERGHGEFSFSVGGESFRGEATRDPNSVKGVANASGNRGGFVRCDYTMSSAQLGTGRCNFSSGARYDIHVSQ